MGGGASKKNSNVTPVTETNNNNKNNNSDNNNTNNYNRTYGPKNGELAPLPYMAPSTNHNPSNNNNNNLHNTQNNTSMNNVYMRPTWNDTVPLQPIASNKTKTIQREETPVVPISVLPTPLEPKPAKPSPSSSSTSSNSTTNASASPPLSIPSQSTSSPSPSLSISPTHLNPPSTADLIIRGQSPNSLSSPPQPFLSSSPSPDEPARSVSPPPLSIDPFKNKHALLERKLSEGINSPITRFKHALAGSAEKFSTHEEDQVLVDDEDEEQAGKEKSTADKYYENFAVDKPKMPGKNYKSNNSSGINTPVSGFKRQQLQHASSVTFHLSDSEGESENEGENNEMNDEVRATTAEIGTSRKNFPVPTLKLNEIGTILFYIYYYCRFRIAINFAFDKIKNIKYKELYFHKYY